MKLKKFAMLALILTTASSFTTEPVTTVTAIASEVVSEGPVLNENNTTSSTDVSAGTSVTDNSVASNSVAGNSVTDNFVADTSAASQNTSSGESTESNAAGNTNAKNNNVKNNNKKSKKSKKTNTKKSKKIKSKTTNKKAKSKLRSSRKSNYTKADLRLMSSIINCEAGIEPYQGKLAVGIVVMNRIKSKIFPNTLKGVIYQSGQFSPVRNGSLSKRLSQYDSGRIKSKQWKSCISAARKVLNGQRTILYRGKEKKMDSFHFFSVGLRGARMSIGGHKFK